MAEKKTFPKVDTNLHKTKKPQPKTQQKSKVDKNYSLIREIHKEKYYKENVPRRNKEARKYIVNECPVVGLKSIIPGQLVSFDYFTPKTEEELEYYDARPVTIFFGVFDTKEGQRIMGFNIHYYPPRIRFQVMDRIMEIWKPMYQKVWDTGLSNKLMHFDYQWLQMQLENAGLGFGVRMYIPQLTKEVRVVPPKEWQKAVFTEGEFRKRTREAIMKYWLNYSHKNK